MQAKQAVGNHTIVVLSVAEPTSGVEYLFQRP